MFEHQRNGFKGNFTILNIVLFMSSLHIMPGNHFTSRIRSKTPPNIKLTFLSFFFCRCVFPKQLMTQHLRCKVLLRQFRKYSDDYLFCKMLMWGCILVLFCICSKGLSPSGYLKPILYLSATARPPLEYNNILSRLLAVQSSNF